MRAGKHVRNTSCTLSDSHRAIFAAPGSVRAFALSDVYGYLAFDYDAAGLGAGVRGDARRINENRRADSQPEIDDRPFRGSGAVEYPDGELRCGLLTPLGRLP